MPSPSAPAPAVARPTLARRAPPGLRRRRHPSVPGVRDGVRLAAAVGRTTGGDLLARRTTSRGTSSRQRPSSDEGAVVRAADRTRSSAAVPRRVLDVGCATGEFLGAVERPGRELLRRRPQRSRDRAGGGHAAGGATFHAGTLVDQPFGDERFDAVTMIDFIEHVRDPETSCDWRRDRLDAGGVSSSRPLGPTRRVARATRRHWPQYREEHLTYFTLSGLSAALQRAGLVVVRSFATRKAVTPAYVYGQAIAYPLPVITPVAQAMWRALPLDRIGPRTALVRRDDRRGRATGRHRPTEATRAASGRARRGLGRGSATGPDGPAEGAARVGGSRSSTSSSASSATPARRGSSCSSGTAGRHRRACR